MNNVLQPEVRVVTLDGMTELVRGNDARLVSILAPMVSTESVALDMTSVHRIDAAGIAALISVYGCAREVGHEFHIVNVSARVGEILSLVGLEHILVSGPVMMSTRVCCEQRPAA